MKELTVNYDVWKLTAGVMPSFYIGNVADGFRVFSSSDVVFVETEASGANAVHFNANYLARSTQVESRDDAYLRGLIASKAPLVTVRDADGTEKVIQELRSDSRLIVTTHNLCDRTTWYQDSVRVADETMTRVDDRVFSSLHEGWIDLSHGKVSDENEVAASHLPIVMVDGVVMVEDAPFGDGGDGDFSIDYALGRVSFHSDVPPGSVVTASYSHSRSSVFTVAPTDGRMLRMVETECQLSTDLIMMDDLWYGIYVTLPGIGERVVKEKRYKRIVDFLNDATGSYPVIPAMGGAKRGTVESVVFPWSLKSRTDLFHRAGMSLKVRMANDIPCGGSFATVSFYFLSIPE